MSLTIKSIDEKLSNIVTETDSLFDKARYLVKNDKDIFIKLMEFEKNIDLFLNNIPDVFENNSVFIKLKEDKIPEIIVKFKQILIECGCLELSNLGNSERNFLIKDKNEKTLLGLLLIDKMKYKQYFGDPEDLNLEELIKTNSEIKNAVKSIYNVFKDAKIEKKLKFELFSDIDIIKIKNRVKKYYDIAKQL
ncbi:hypothetical protein ACWNT8_15590 (plasmid) [Pigmentibacter ruber]|nr:hypothetical protein GTC16762_32660 [Pigmentibacter ruber]